jgi:ribonuclease J
LSDSAQQILPTLPVPDRGSIMVVPLGGTSRVGMNVTLVGHAGRWIMVDVGATFAGADDDRAAEAAKANGGVLEQIIPDFRALAGVADRIDGIVLTHAHEDHVGGLPPLFNFAEAWPRLARTRIVATPYTLGVVRAKLKETGRKPQLSPMRHGHATRIGPFEITPVRMTHSAPETSGLVIRVKGLQPIFLATDFKLDRDPVLGELTDTETLSRLGREGVLAVLADSTNAGHSGWSVSEGEVRTGLSRIMASHPGRIVISTFASNLARIVGISEAAAASGRRLAGKGRSILRNVEIGYETGVLRQRQVRLLDPRDVMGVPRRQTAMVCTGTQAETGSALQRLADDLHSGRRSHTLALEPGDLIIHSARVIPGNEATVRSMFDTFRSRGVDVLEAGGPGPATHASGHARRDELAELYRMLNPRFAVPMHGHRELTAAHEDLALSLGVQAARSPAEGEVMRIGPLGLQILGRFEIGTLATIAVGGRNAGETRLIGWERASSPDLTVEHKPLGRRDGGRPSASRGGRPPAPARQARPEGEAVAAPRDQPRRGRRGRGGSAKAAVEGAPAVPGVRQPQSGRPRQERAPADRGGQGRQPSQDRQAAQNRQDPREGQAPQARPAQGRGGRPSQGAPRTEVPAPGREPQAPRPARFGRRRSGSRTRPEGEAPAPAPRP